MRSTLRPFLFVACAAVFAPMALAQPAASADTQELTPEVKQQLLERVTKVISENAYVPGVDFTKWNEFMGKQKEAIDKAKTPLELTNALNRAMREFGFSHIVLSSPEATKMMRERKMVGLGVRIAVIEEGIRIEYVFPKGGADEAGIQVNDIIIEANGKKPEGREAFAGDEGTKIKVKVKKPNGTIKDLEVTRKSFSTVMPETLTWPEKDVAVLTIPDFMTYDMQRVDRLIEEANKKAKMMIVDLRSNGGGAVLNLLHLCGRILPPNAEIGTFINRRTVRTYVEQTKGKETDLVEIAKWSKDKLRGMRGTSSPSFNGAVTVLINGGTGSASEMMAAAIREIRGGAVIGSPSAGAVLASFMMPMPGGFTLQYPFQDYVTIKGLRLEGNGVKPDIAAPMPGPGEPDKAVLAAVKWYRDQQATQAKK